MQEVIYLVFISMHIMASFPTVKLDCKLVLVFVTHMSSNATVCAMEY